MLNKEKILITGVTGKIAFPIARSLAKDNEVWGVARMSSPGDENRLKALRIRLLKRNTNETLFDYQKINSAILFHRYSGF